MSVIKIQEINIEFTKKGKNGWHTAEVTYTDEEKGKNFTKKLMSFANPKVFGVIQEAKVGDRFDVEVKKEGEFWNWVAIQPAEASESPKASPSRTSPPGAGTTATRAGGWETPEERARKQVYIVKQSSISAAISLLGASAAIDEVLETAQRFVDYVFQSEDNGQEVEAMDGGDAN